MEAVGFEAGLAFGGAEVAAGEFAAGEGSVAFAEGVGEGGDAVVEGAAGVGGVGGHLLAVFEAEGEEGTGDGAAGFAGAAEAATEGAGEDEARVLVEGAGGGGGGEDGLGAVEGVEEGDGFFLRCLFHGWGCGWEQYTGVGRRDGEEFPLQGGRAGGRNLGRLEFPFQRIVRPGAKKCQMVSIRFSRTGCRANMISTE